MDANAAEMAAVWRALRQRYPLLERIVIQSLGGASAERFPAFFGLFLAALDDPAPAPCCFVLPKRGQMARLAAIMFGLSVFRREFNSLAQEYAKREFQEGQRVRVLPGNHVYTFGGFWPNQPDKFRLRTLDGLGSRTFPANDVLRLEPTQRVTPRGRLDTNITVPEETALDRILGIHVFGNLSLFRNEVLCLDEQVHFTEFTDEHSFRDDGSEEICRLTELLPFGWLREDSGNDRPKFKNWSTRYPNAEPLVAVTSSAERLAAFCTASPKRSKVVVVNGLRVVSNLQAFDEIASTQRLVLFADQDDAERMCNLEARGCRFWIFGAREFFSEPAPPDDSSTGGVFGRVLYQARNFADLRIHAIVCDCEELSRVAVQLEELRSDIEAEAQCNPDGRLARIAVRFWRILNQAAAFCDQLSSVERDQMNREVQALASELKASVMWIAPEIITKLEGALGLLQQLFQVGSELGRRKGILLTDSVRAAISAGRTVAVVTRTDAYITSTARLLKSHGFNVPVFSLAGIPDTESFDQLIITSWPGAEAFRRLTANLITGDILTVAYDFEARWVSQFQRRLSERPKLTTFTPREKGSLVTAGKYEEIWPEEKAVTISAPSAPSSTFDIWTYEQRLRSVRKGGASASAEGATVRAKYVSFVGDSYAFLTQWHKLPVVTRLLAAGEAKPKSLPEKVVDELRPGDLVVFPEGGEKAVIAAIADRLIGSDATSIRKRARFWREALVSSNLTPEQFLTQAKKFGHARHIATIRNWYYDEAQIGPGEREDLDLIAVVTGSTDLIDHAGEVWDAITFLRSHHLSAGSALRDAVVKQLRQALPAVGENGSRIEVPNLGAAWVVEVDSIASEYTDEARNQSDRLLWADL